MAGDKDKPTKTQETQKDRKEGGTTRNRTQPSRDFPNRLLRVFGLLDFLFAWTYLLIFIYVVPPFDPTVKWVAYAVSFTIMAGGLVMWTGGKVAFWAGLSVAAFLLTVCFIVVGLLVASAAYLYGLYGAFGKGATYVTLFAVSLVVTYVGLLPVFQMAYLLKARPKVRAAS